MKHPSEIDKENLAKKKAERIAKFKYRYKLERHLNWDNDKKSIFMHPWDDTKIEEKLNTLHDTSKEFRESIRSVTVLGFKCDLETIQKLSRIVIDMINIRSVSFSETYMDNASALKIMKALVNKTELISLNFRDNEFDTIAVNSMVEVIKTAPKLKVLNLNNNWIEFNGAEALLNAIHQQGSLEALYFAENPIGAEGLLKFTRLLAINNTLTTVQLPVKYSYHNLGISYRPDCYANEEMLTEFVKILENNCTLYDLKMDFYFYDIIKNPKFTEILTRNKQLQIIPGKLQSIAESCKPKLDTVLMIKELAKQCTTNSEYEEALSAFNSMSFDTKIIQEKIETLLKSYDQFIGIISQTLHKKIQIAAELAIIEYFARDGLELTDYHNIVTLFLFMPIVEDDFSNLFATCLGYAFLKKNNETTPNNVENCFFNKLDIKIEDVIIKINALSQYLNTKDKALLIKIEEKFFPEYISVKSPRVSDFSLFKNDGGEKQRGKNLISPKI